jgi:hypothetical protein
LDFIWFWTFWHWSLEGFRGGAFLRGPLHGIAGHWDEWFRHEASEQERRAIAAVGRNAVLQRRFVVWLARHWARDAEWRAERPPTRFVLGQLAQLPPFTEWPAFDAYRAGYGACGVAAIVLAEGSQGVSTDVRSVEAIALPADPGAPRVVTEGFEADHADLTTARRAALSVLAGRGLGWFMALWMLSGRRPYPRWLAIALSIGWLCAGGVIVLLLVGPEPGERLLPLATALASLWIGLVTTAAVTACALGFRAWRVGRRLADRMRTSQIWLRMSGGLTIRGGSAGLPFCLDMLLAVHRADRAAASRSWLWSRCLRRLRLEAGAWAATGGVTANAQVTPVILEPKIRASLVQPAIRHVLTPRQADATRRSLARMARTVPPASDGSDQVAHAHGAHGARRRLGLAAEARRLTGHRCRHVAQSLLIVGDLATWRQAALNTFALVVSVVMLAAAGDLSSILHPPAVPRVVGPSATSPYYLWVSLDTRQPEHFAVVLESDFWSNRRAKVLEYGGIDAPPRAEIRLHRLASEYVRDPEDGTVWIERRRTFLSREFAAGERVGRYSLSYISRLGQQ